MRYLGQDDQHSGNGDHRCRPPYLQSSIVDRAPSRIYIRSLRIYRPRPSVLRRTFRLLLWIPGPINVLMDLYWLPGDDYNETSRAPEARPAGTGEIRLNRYRFRGHSFVFYEVQKPAQG